MRKEPKCQYIPQWTLTPMELVDARWVLILHIEAHGMLPLIDPFDDIAMAVCQLRNLQILIWYRRRSSRGRKDAGIVGQASWISSVINLVNTSTPDNLLRMSIHSLNNSPWSWNTRYASGAFKNGHFAGTIDHNMVRCGCRVWTLSSDPMRQISGTRICVLFFALSNYISECRCHIWCRHRY